MTNRIGKKQRDKKFSDTYSGHYAAASWQIWNRGNTTPKQQADLNTEY